MDRRDEYLIAHDGNGGAGTWGVHMISTPGRVQLRLAGTQYSLDGPDTSGGAWHLCFITADRSANAELTVDGTGGTTVSIAADVATDLTSATTFYIARRESTLHFIGSMDEVAFWKGTLLSSGQIADIQAAL